MKTRKDRYAGACPASRACACGDGVCTSSIRDFRRSNDRRSLERGKHRSAAAVARPVNTGNAGRVCQFSGSAVPIPPNCCNSDAGRLLSRARCNFPSDLMAIDNHPRHAAGTRSRPSILYDAGPPTARSGVTQVLSVRCQSCPDTVDENAVIEILTVGLISQPRLLNNPSGRHTRGAFTTRRENSAFDSTRSTLRGSPVNRITMVPSITRSLFEHVSVF